MGGTGSGRWTYHEKKKTVEGCWSISISQIARTIDLRNPQPVPGGLRPKMPKTGKRMSPVRCTLQIGGDVTPVLMLSYAVKDRWRLEHQVEETVRLQTTQPNFGGVRWWFSCPRKVDGGRCGRRVEKLYRPPDHRRFACRNCLDLTYETCQQSGRYDGLCAQMAGGAYGETFEAVKQAFAYKKDRSRRRVPTSLKLLDVFDKVFGELDSR